MKLTGNILIDYTKWVLRCIAIGALVVVTVGLIILAGVAGLQWFTHDRHVAHIKVNIFSPTQPMTDGKTLCSDPAYPIFVAYTNESVKTISNIAIRVTAHLPGRSTDVLRYSSVDFDFVTKPGGGNANCYSFAILDEYKAHQKEAEYQGTVATVTFSD